jgi:hypothetical protein
MSGVISAQEGSIFFQQDGTPPHFHGEVCRHLNIHFQKRRVGQAGPVSWPPQSTNLIPLDFLIWEFGKDKA